MDIFTSQLSESWFYFNFLINHFLGASYMPHPGNTMINRMQSDRSARISIMAVQRQGAERKANHDLEPIMGMTL